MNFKTTVAPASEPIDLATAKVWLTVPSDDTGMDSLITALISEARVHVETNTGLRFLTQTIQQALDRFPYAADPETPNAEIWLGVSPLIAVTSISYLDGVGDSQTIDSSNYVVDTIGKPPRVAPNFGYTWPETYAVINAVTVTYTVGHAATTDAHFPKQMLTALKLWMCGMFETRQDYAKRYKDASMAIMDNIKVKKF